MIGSKKRLIELANDAQKKADETVTPTTRALYRGMEMAYLDSADRVDWDKTWSRGEDE